MKKLLETMAIFAAATLSAVSLVSCKGQEEQKVIDRDFYVNQVDSLFSYWREYRDTQWGGILNCITNDGTSLVSTDKYAWSQGRWLYTLSKLYELKDKFPGVDSVFVREWMEETKNFIEGNCLYDDYRTCFLLRQDGTHVLDEATGRYDTSIYADTFVLIGLSEYAVATGVYNPLTEKIADSIISRIENGDFLSSPYEIPAGYSVHGIPMIMLNTMQVFCDMEKAFGKDCAKYEAYADKCFETIFIKHRDAERGFIREYVSTDENRSVLLADRHVNPGHNLEDIWFIIEYLESRGTLDKWQGDIDKVVKSVFELGWDKQYGGLLRYVDYDQADGNQQVRGTNTHTAYDELVASTWDMKLWWAHSELLFLFTKLYATTGNPEWLDYYKTSYDYTFATFPSSENAEWIQIRKRDGTPQDKVVALPVKDPFHILRDFIKIVETLDKK